MPIFPQESFYWLLVFSRRGLRFFGTLFIALVWLGLSAAQGQTTNYRLGTASLLIGPGQGSNSVVLAVTPTNNAWTATANAPWLQLDAVDQSGAGSTNVIFSYDANPGPTRSGTLAIGDQTLTVTQAGSSYVAAGQMTTLVSLGASNGSGGLALDSSGNVFFSEYASTARL